MAEIDPYAGLSDEAREACLRRMTKTLTSMPRHKKTRAYIRSLTGERETPAQLRARARRAVDQAAKRAAAMVIAKAVIAKTEKAPTPAIRRKDRLSPTARQRWNEAHPTKGCRRAIRHRPEFRTDGKREPRAMEVAFAQRHALIAAQGGLCAICGTSLPKEFHRVSFDHVIPRALGGVDAIGNFVVTHGECNGDKSNDIPTGCEMIWLLMVNAKLGVLPIVY